MTENIKNSRELINKPDSVRSLFDDETKETNKSSPDEDENNEVVSGYETEKYQSDIAEDEEDT